MKELTELLEKLAVKLGTTTERLWGVLLKQAPISGIIDIILCLVLVILCICGFQFVRRKTSTKTLDKYGDYCAEWENEGAFSAWFGITTFAGISLVLIIGSMEGIVTAFFNPEYWALMKILAKSK